MRPLRTLAVLAALASAALLTPPAQAATTVRTSAATTYRGEGDQLLRVRTTTKPGIVKITHNGEGHFAVWTLNANGRTHDLVANRVGAYTGTVALPPGTRYASIEANGAWSIVRR